MSRFHGAEARRSDWNALAVSRKKRKRVVRMDRIGNPLGMSRGCLG